MPRRFTGRVCVVTGGGRGLGRAIAQRLASEGAAVAILDRVGAEDAASTIQSAGEIVLPYECDVTDRASVDRAVRDATGALGGVDVLVNNAGRLSGRKGFLEVDKDEMLSYYATNVVGYLHLIQACFPWLRDSPHHGRVINVASRTFFTGSRGQLAYVASKGGVLGMTRVIARELGDYGITVNSVMPSQVATPGTEAHVTQEMFESTMQQQAIRAPVRPEDFAGLVAFLASDDAIFVTGQSIVCDGGGYFH